MHNGSVKFYHQYPSLLMEFQLAESVCLIISHVHVLNLAGTSHQLVYSRELNTFVGVYQLFSPAILQFTSNYYVILFHVQ